MNASAAPLIDVFETRRGLCEVDFQFTCDPLCPRNPLHSRDPLHPRDPLCLSDPLYPCDPLYSVSASCYVRL